jgi:hypothetical protein
LDELNDDIFNKYPFCRKNSFSISNRGVCDRYIKTNSDIVIHEMYNTATSYNMGHLVNLFCTTLNNTCFITYHCCLPILSQDEFDNFSNTIDQILDHIVNQE